MLEKDKYYQFCYNRQKEQFVNGQVKAIFKNKDGEWNTCGILSPSGFKMMVIRSQLEQEPIEISKAEQFKNGLIHREQ